MHLKGLILALLIGLRAFVAEATDAVPLAEEAAADLRAAITALDAARGAKDRVAALTVTIRAYEKGLAALRDALRQASVREAEIAAAFEARRVRIATLLGTMTAIEEVPAPLLLLHPAGPLGSARSGMILSSVAPALQDEAEALRIELTEIRSIRAVQEAAAGTLQDGLIAVQEARTALSKAMQDRTDLPTRFLEDPEELRLLVSDAETLDSFAAGLAGLEMDIGAPTEDFAGAEGSLPLPAFGNILRRADEADAAGIRRPGILLATRPAALVTTPWPATIRYRGPLLDYGNVMILEPATGYLLILAGMGSVYGETGDVLAAGAPVGLMGGAEPATLSDPADLQEGGGAGRSETLYIEIRKGEEPVDPATWFTETKED